ncbi:MAG: TlpA disulfide reductase family protein [Burkholderiaceae bacterium]
MSKRLFAAAALIALVAAGGLFLVNQKTPVPLVQGSSLSGQLIDTQALKGKPYLVNFWATSCVTCVKEMPDLKALQTQFAPQGFSILAVAMAYDKPEFIERFAQERELPFVFLHDRDGRWARAFGDVAVTPTTFLVDAQGQMIKRYVGQPDFKQLNGLIQSLLK